jgi:hypothetical protein
MRPAYADFVRFLIRSAGRTAELWHSALAQ